MHLQIVSYLLYLADRFMCYHPTQFQGLMQHRPHPVIPLCRPESFSRSPLEEADSLPTISEASPEAEGNLGNSCRSEPNLLQASSSHPSSGSLAGSISESLHGAAGSEEGSLKPLMELRDIMRRLNFTRCVRDKATHHAC